MPPRKSIKRARQYHEPGVGSRTGMRIDEKVEGLNGFLEAGKRAMRPSLLEPSMTLHFSQDEEDGEEDEKEGENKLASQGGRKSFVKGIGRGGRSNRSSMDVEQSSGPSPQAMLRRTIRTRQPNASSSFISNRDDDQDQSNYAHLDFDQSNSSMIDHGAPKRLSRHTFSPQLSARSVRSRRYTGSPSFVHQIEDEGIDRTNVPTKQPIRRSDGPFFNQQTSSSSSPSLKRAKRKALDAGLQARKAARAAKESYFDVSLHDDEYGMDGYDNGTRLRGIKEKQARLSEHSRDAEPSHSDLDLVDDVPYQSEHGYASELNDAEEEVRSLSPMSAVSNKRNKASESLKVKNGKGKERGKKAKSKSKSKTKPYIEDIPYVIDDTDFQNDEGNVDEDVEMERPSRKKGKSKPKARTTPKGKVKASEKPTSRAFALTLDDVAEEATEEEDDDDGGKAGHSRKETNEESRKKGVGAIGPKKKKPTERVNREVVERVPSSNHYARDGQSVESGEEDGLAVRRGKRYRYAPLEFWRGERAKYGRPSVPKRQTLGTGDRLDETVGADAFEDGPESSSGLPPGAVLKEIIRVARGEGEGTFSGMRVRDPSTSAHKRSGERMKRTRVASEDSRGSREISEDPYELIDPTEPTRHAEDGWDADTQPMKTVWDPDEEQEVERRLACTASQLQPRMAYHSSFGFQKVFGVDDYMAAGVLIVEVEGHKPTKSSKDNNYFFVVLEGAVQVHVHRSNFRVAPGGMFFIPRGNSYSLENVSPRQLRLFFAQARLP